MFFLIVLVDPVGSITRLPIIEGSCPDTIEELEPVLEAMDKHIVSGHHVLCHCRGGVGRAGLVACCYLIKKAYVNSAERAIQFVRMRRVK